MPPEMWACGRFREIQPAALSRGVEELARLVTHEWEKGRLSPHECAKLQAGMAKAEVEALLGAPTECAGAIGISSCNWGDEKTFISVQYAGDKVLLFSGQGLK